MNDMTLNKIRAIIQDTNSRSLRSLSDPTVSDRQLLTKQKSTKIRQTISSEFKQDADEARRSAILESMLNENISASQLRFKLKQYQWDQNELILLLLTHKNNVQKRFQIIQEHLFKTGQSECLNKLKQLIKTIIPIEKIILQTSTQPIKHVQLRNASTQLIACEILRPINLISVSKESLINHISSSLKKEIRTKFLTRADNRTPVLKRKNSGGFTAKNRLLNRPSSSKSWLTRYRLAHFTLYAITLALGLTIGIATGTGLIGLGAAAFGLSLGSGFGFMKKKFENSAGKLAASSRVRSNKYKLLGNISRMALILLSIAAISFALAPLAGIPVAGVSMLTLAKVSGGAFVSSSSIVIGSAVLSRTVSRYYYDRYKKVSIDRWSLTRKDKNILNKKVFQQYHPEQKKKLKSTVNLAVKYIQSKKKKYSTLHTRQIHKRNTLDYYKMALIKIKEGNLNYLSRFLEEEKTRQELKLQQLSIKRSKISSNATSALIINNSLQETLNKPSISSDQETIQYATNLARQQHSHEGLMLSKADISYIKQWYEYQMFLNHFYTEKQDASINLNKNIEYHETRFISKEISALRLGKNNNKKSQFIAPFLTSVGVIGGFILITGFSMGFAYIPIALAASFATVSLVYGAYEACKNTLNIVTGHKPSSSAWRLAAGTSLAVGLCLLSILVPPIGAITLTSLISTQVVFSSVGMFAGSWLCKQVQRGYRYYKYNVTNTKKNTLNKNELDAIVSNSKTIHSQQMKNQAIFVMSHIHRQLRSYRLLNGFLNPKSFLRYFLLSSRQRNGIETYQNMIFNIKNEGYPYLQHITKELKQLLSAKITYHQKRMNLDPESKSAILIQSTISQNAKYFKNIKIDTKHKKQLTNSIVEQLKNKGLPTELLGKKLNELVKQYLDLIEFNNNTTLILPRSRHIMTSRKGQSNRPTIAKNIETQPKIKNQTLEEIPTKRSKTVLIAGGIAATGAAICAKMHGIHLPHIGFFSQGAAISTGGVLAWISSKRKKPKFDTSGEMSNNPLMLYNSQIQRERKQPLVNKTIATCNKSDATMRRQRV